MQPVFRLGSIVNENLGKRNDTVRSIPEKMETTFFQMSNEPSKESFELQVKNKVQTFIAHLFLDEVNPNILPSGSLDSLVRAIHGICKSNFRAVLIGSWVSLNRVNAIDSVRWCKEAIISEILRKNAQDCYVLTEALLGGVFFGVGKSESNPSETEMNKISMVHFISLGAIPKVSQTFQECDLWEVYADWKNKLENDELTGYPIQFKLKKLADMLEENHECNSYSK